MFVVLVLVIDTGCGCGNIYFFIKQQQRIIEKKKIIVVNTHNHPEQVLFFIFSLENLGKLHCHGYFQTGGNFRFSTIGKLGLSHMVEDLCASGKDQYYTKLMNSNWHWQVLLPSVTATKNKYEKNSARLECQSKNRVKICVHIRCGIGVRVYVLAAGLNLCYVVQKPVSNISSLVAYLESLMFSKNNYSMLIPFFHMQWSLKWYSSASFQNHHLGCVT